VKRPSATGSEKLVVVDAACAAIFQQTIVQINTPLLRGYFYHAIQRWFIPAMVEGWQGSGYRTRIAFGDTFLGNAVQVSTPRVRLIAARSFLLEGRSGSSLSSRTGLPASRSRDSQMLAPPCGGHASPFRVARGGRRIYAGFGPAGAFQSRPRVSTWRLFISKGEYVFLIRREQIHRYNRVPSSCCRRHLL